VTGLRTAVEVIVKGETYCARYCVAGGMLAASTGLVATSAPIGGIPPEALALSGRGVAGTHGLRARCSVETDDAGLGPEILSFRRAPRRLSPPL
jgi:hypothetical protein